MVRAAGPPRPQGVCASTADQSTSTYPAFWVEPRPRWRSARPGPHKLYGIECHFLNHGSRTPVDCRAISLPPLADIIADVRATQPRRRGKNGRERVGGFSCGQLAWVILRRLECMDVT